MGAEIHPTPHLIEKMKARDVTWGEIVGIIEKPAVVFGPDIQGRKVYQKGDLAVVVAASGAVITVLLKETEQWTDEQARNRKL